MKDILVKDIIDVCQGKIACGSKENAIKNVVRDTREVKKGDTYIGFKGEHHDGSLMYEEALQNGASVCILQNESVKDILDIQLLEKNYPDSTIILVDNAIKALQEIAKFKRSLYNIPVVGITGSVGKTSTKDIIASVMAKKYNVHKTQGNYNNQIGVPLTVMGLKDHNAMVIEMGMNMPNEISALSQIAKPSVAVITNVGTAHIGNLGSRENILKAKLEILDGLDKDGTLIINNDNDMLHNWYEGYKENNNNVKSKSNDSNNDEINNSKNIKIVTFGMENQSDIMPYDVKLSENGSSYKIDVDGKTYNVNISVGGNHFVLNSLCAIAVGRQFEINMEEILEGIANFELTKRRMQVEKNKEGITIINDCYNANYDSMKAALEYLGKLTANKKIAVLGDMLELGDFSKELHEKVGEEVYKNNIDILITVGPMSKDIVAKAVEKGMNKGNTHLCENNNQAIELVKLLAQKGDAVLLKASNGLNFQEIFNEIIK